MSSLRYRPVTTCARLPSRFDALTRVGGSHCEWPYTRERPCLEANPLSCIQRGAQTRAFRPSLTTIPPVEDPAQTTRA
jgi:hypothetical protein